MAEADDKYIQWDIKWLKDNNCPAVIHLWDATCLPEYDSEYFSQEDKLKFKKSLKYLTEKVVQNYEQEHDEIKALGQCIIRYEIRHFSKVFYANGIKKAMLRDGCKFKPGDKRHSMSNGIKLFIKKHMANKENIKKIEMSPSTLDQFCVFITECSFSHSLLIELLKYNIIDPNDDDPNDEGLRYTVSGNKDSMICLFRHFRNIREILIQEFNSIKRICGQKDPNTLGSHAITQMSNGWYQILEKMHINKKAIPGCKHINFKLIRGNEQAKRQYFNWQTSIPPTTPNKHKNKPNKPNNTNNKSNVHKECIGCNDWNKRYDTLKEYVDTIEAQGDDLLIDLDEKNGIINELKKQLENIDNTYSNTVAVGNNEAIGGIGNNEAIGGIGNNEAIGGTGNEAAGNPELMRKLQKQIENQNEIIQKQNSDLSTSKYLIFKLFKLLEQNNVHYMFLTNKSTYATSLRDEYKKELLQQQYEQEKIRLEKQLQQQKQQMEFQRIQLEQMRQRQTHSRDRINVMNNDNNIVNAADNDGDVIVGNIIRPPDNDGDVIVDNIAPDDNAMDVVGNDNDEKNDELIGIDDEEFNGLTDNDVSIECINDMRSKGW
eukprot:21193_1